MGCSPTATPIWLRNIHWWSKALKLDLFKEVWDRRRIKRIQKILLLVLITGEASTTTPNPCCIAVKLLTNCYCLLYIWLQNFNLCYVWLWTSQFSASGPPTFYSDSFPVNYIPNPLDRESDEFVLTNSEGYVETEVDWFNEPQLVETTKWQPSKKSEAVALKVSWSYIFLPTLIACFHFSEATLTSAKRNTPCHALQDFYLADALPHQ